MSHVKLTLISMVAVLNGSPAMASHVLTPRRRILGTRRIFALLHAGPSTRFQTLFGLRAAPRSFAPNLSAGAASSPPCRDTCAGTLALCTQPGSPSPYSTWLAVVLQFSE